MKKKFFVLFLVLVAGVLAFGTAEALVSGTCSNCHTMHDSQDGSGDEGVAGQQDNLTLGDCVYCHTGNVVASAPQIDGTGAGGVTAGGDVDGDGTSTSRHDISDMGVALDTTTGGIAGLTPPGGTDLAAQLSCNSTNGCHGTAFHHTESGDFRSLGRIASVNGLESASYEAGGATTTDHNVYDADGVDSISAFCADCHTNFHEDTATDGVGTGSASPFQRHPTDEEGVIANVDGAGFTPTSAQVDETPFGFSSAEISAGMVTTDMTTGTAYTSGNGEVVCVSCHRAHGSGQSDMLRFTYSTMNAGNSTDEGGCETCHVAQQ